jgi:hypothetical protein
MPLATGVIVQLSYRVEYQSQRYLFTHHYRVANNNSTQDTAQDTASIAFFFSQTGANDLMTRYRICLATDAVVREVVAQPIHPQRLVRRSVAVSLAGTSSGTASTGNIAAVLTLRTQLAGRSQVSNKHIGPPATVDIGAGLIGANLQAALINLGNELDDNQTVPADLPNEILLVPVIFHKSSGTHDVLVSSIISTRVGTMRRRTLRVGE